ncbi:putative oxidoreductase [Mucilaginibacter yixingensis]|uniref:Putative oxidoreductase n=1 Tax=Mucilaginibacter yixingensis TaxID=1295612 RepID=A0A2T5JBJ8_9SPHI|nr:DoxX family protein [Mucilaginibacter yixingensis]PTQ98240.1 putative oxidoreductase [Mucilaginibacter yixingensis]
MLNNLFSVGGKNHRQLAPLFLRMAIGFGFMAHGWAKLSRGPEAFAQLLTLIKVPAPQVLAWVTTLTELTGGFALFVGALVSLVAIPLICTMVVAMFSIHIHYGYSAVKTIGLTPHGPLFGPPGYEINLIYIAGLISLLITGAGRFSIDALLAKTKTIQ